MDSSSFLSHASVGMLRSNPATSVSLEGSSTVVRAPTERQADQDVGLLPSGSVDLLEGMDASPPPPSSRGQGGVKQYAMLTPET